MARQHDRSGVIRFCHQVIRANPSLSDGDLEEQLEAVWKSGYQAGRKVTIREALVSRGVEVLGRMREETARKQEKLNFNSNRFAKARAIKHLVDK